MFVIYKIPKNIRIEIEQIYNYMKQHNELLFLK